jgi:hypothetical protein
LVAPPPRDRLRACVGKSLSGLESQLDLELNKRDGWMGTKGGRRAGSHLFVKQIPGVLRPNFLGFSAVLSLALFFFLSLIATSHNPTKLPLLLHFCYSLGFCFGELF